MLQDNFDELPEHVHVNKDQRISKSDVPVCVSLVSFVHRLSHHTSFLSILDSPDHQVHWSC
jgi:hypothetical protein